MTSVNGGAQGQFGYDGDGKRVRKAENGTTTYYAYSSVLGVALFELTGTGTINRVHVTAGGKEIAQLATDGGFYWLHTDHLGTPRKMTNGTGVTVYRGEFDPHGNTLLEWSVINNPNLNNNKFTGYERDNAAGLDFAQARHYSYGRGRFVQPDPSGLKAAILKKPETLNQYAYVNNDPINFRDPSGLNAEDPNAGKSCTTRTDGVVNGIIGLDGNCHETIVGGSVTISGGGGGSPLPPYIFPPVSQYWAFLQQLVGIIRAAVGRYKEVVVVDLPH